MSAIQVDRRWLDYITAQTHTSCSCELHKVSGTDQIQESFNLYPPQGAFQFALKQNLHFEAKRKSHITFIGLLCSSLRLIPTVLSGIVLKLVRKSAGATLSFVIATNSLMRHPCSSYKGSLFSNNDHQDKSLNKFAAKIQYRYVT